MEPAISLVEPGTDVRAAMRAIGAQAREAARALANAPAQAKTDALHRRRRRAAPKRR